MGNEGSLWKTLADYSASADDDLVQRALAGEPLARRALVDRYLPLIYSVCRRSGLAKQDADDVAQTIVMRMFQTLAKFRGESKLSTWIFTLAKRGVADHFRHPHRREEPVDWSAPTQENLTSQLEQKHDYAAHRDADKLTQRLNTLDEPARSIMLLFYLADESVGDIAQALNLPEGTVKTHLFRSRAWLRQQLELTP